NNPVKWWWKRSSKFLCLDKLCRCVLTIPTAQANSEHMFSTARIIVT
ncbi:unnamed protein product, partial [Choristocarpus tenellus]